MLTKMNNDARPSRGSREPDQARRQPAHRRPQPGQAADARGLRRPRPIEDDKVHEKQRQGLLIGPGRRVDVRPAGHGGQAWPSLSQAWPSNRLVTEPSSKTSWMARLISGAIDSTVSLSNSCASSIGSVLVTMTSAALQFLSRSMAGSGQDRVGRGDDHARGAVGHQGVGRLGDRAAGVDHVVDQDADPALDLTDDAVGDGLVGAVDVSRLVDERQRGSARAAATTARRP